MEDQGGRARRQAVQVNIPRGWLAAFLLSFASCAGPGPHPSHGAGEPHFPVKPEPFITRFGASEGITFNGEGQLFIGADKAIWIAEPDGAVRKIADVDLHLGQAGIGKRDILAADFGPTNAFRHGPNNDGIVWRITPEGEKKVFATGIGDPNALVRMPEGTWLVSDDATDNIYRLDKGQAHIWSTAVPFPNGMVLSRDRRLLYVAQIFTRLKPLTGDQRIWAIPVEGSRPAGPAKVVALTGGGGPDGLAADEQGRIYIADNGAGKILRFDPQNGSVITIAENVPGVASLVFGEGEFDRTALYATSTKGGVVWKIKVGVRGARQSR